MTLSESTPVAVPNTPGTLQSDSPLTPLDEPSVSFAEEEESIVANASFTFSRATKHSLTQPLIGSRSPPKIGSGGAVVVEI